MAIRYVDSNATGAADGTTKADAFLTLQAAFAAGAPGDLIYPSHLHRQTEELDNADVNLTPTGSISAFQRIYSVDFSGSTPPVKADLLRGARITVTGNTDIAFTGSGMFARFWGVEFYIGTGAAGTGFIVPIATNACHLIFENGCVIRPATGSVGGMYIGAAGVAQKVELIDFDMDFGATADNIYVRGGPHSWRGGSYNGAVVPSAFIRNVSAPSEFLIEGVDLSAITNLNATPTGGGTSVTLKRCKTHASLTVAKPTAIDTVKYYIIDCNNGAINYDNQQHSREGSMTTETTVVRTGGATDNGTAVSRKIVTSSLANLDTPFETLLARIQNTTLSEITITVYGTWGGGAVPNNDDIWIEASYLGSAGSPIATIVHNGLEDTLSTEAAHASDGSTWGGGTTPFKMTLTFTPAMAGPIDIKLKAALASTTFYVDQKPVKT